MRALATVGTHDSGPPLKFCLSLPGSGLGLHNVSAKCGISHVVKLCVCVARLKKGVVLGKCNMNHR